MRSKWSSPVQGKGSLLVLLPGRADTPEDFEKQGFVAMARRAGPDIDVVAADATLGYYARATLPTRLAQDVVEPARGRGYRSIWLAGVSMGGLGTLYYAKNRPETVAGVLAIAPYLGSDDVIEEIERAGGLANWTPASPLDPDDWERALWVWLKKCAAQQGVCPAIFLGYGEADKLARSDRLLAATLPPDHVLVVPGGHEWEPWRRIFAAQIGLLLATRR